MAKSEKNISIAQLDKIMKEHFQNEGTIQWHDIEVKVKRTLSLTDMLGFVDDVVGSCFHDKLGFMPEIMEYAIKSNILTRYANFSMPDNLEHRYQLVYATDAVEAVCAAIDVTQLQEIVNAIHSKIHFLCDSKAAEIEARVNDVLTAMEEMRDSAKSIFDGLTQDDLKNLMSAISANGLDEQKIVQAYIEQTRGKDARPEQADTAGETAEGATSA